MDTGRPGGEPTGERVPHLGSTTEEGTGWVARSMTPYRLEQPTECQIGQNRQRTGDAKVESSDSTDATFARVECDCSTGRRRMRLVTCLTCLHFVLVGCESSLQTPGIVVTDSAGTLLVEVDSLATVEAPPVSRERVFTTSENEIELFGVTTARVLEDGRVAVGNSGMQQVLLLSPTGDSVRTIGREGDGPGEFRVITTLHRASDGGFNVYDARLGRLSGFDAEGELVSTERLSPPYAFADLQPLSISPDGQVLAIYGSLRRLPAEGVQRDTTPLFFFQRPGAYPDTLGRWAMRENLYQREEDGWSLTRVGFGRSLASFGTNQLAVLADTEVLDVLLLDTSGQLVMRVRGAGASIPTTESEGEEWRGDRVALVRSDLPAELRARSRERQSTAPFRESYPALDALAVDAAGRVWIGAAVRYGERERRWVVFGTDGTPVASLQLPANAEILDITATQLLLSSRDELDVEEVSLWQINWPQSDD